MAFKGREIPPVDFANLIVSLNKTGLNVSNQPLYQTIKDLIDKSRQSQGFFNSILQSFFGRITINDDTDLSAILTLISSINNILQNATFWTELDETLNLLASRRAIAGTGITLDYSIANEVTISSSGSGSGLVPMTTGAYPGQIMFIGQRVMMVPA